MISRLTALTALTALSAVVTTATLAYAATATLDQTSAQAAVQSAANKAMPIYLLERVVISGKRVNSAKN